MTAVICDIAKAKINAQDTHIAFLEVPVRFRWFRKKLSEVETLGLATSVTVMMMAMADGRWG